MLSKVILELQKDRYFETLQSKYWNSSKLNDCPVLDDSEGITLQSLGGVFIATLIGLAIAMITLGVEVYMQKKKEKEVKPENASTMVNEKPVMDPIQHISFRPGSGGGGKESKSFATMPAIMD